MTDCLMIGHNEMQFEQYEKVVKMMGIKSGAYRDLCFSFINYNGKPVSYPELYNMCRLNDQEKAVPEGLLHLGNVFNPAIAYLTTYLSKKDLTADYINSFQYNKAELIKKLCENKISTIAIITTLYTSLFPVLEIMQLIKQY